MRLVQKSWLETITKLLQKSKEPLFNLVLDEGNSLFQNVARNGGKLLERFLNAMATKPSLPTFSVKIREHVFVPETHSSLSKLLVLFGAGLIQLELHIPAYSSPKFIFPNFTLPNLRKLRVKLADLILLTATEHSINLSHFINSLLNAAPALTDFVIPSDSFQDLDDDPLAFEFFTLPPSITTLELSCQMTSENLELLLKNDLPKLKSLTLLIPVDEPYSDGLLFRILDKSRTTLRKFMLRGEEEANVDIPGRTTLRFPVMEKLEEFYNYSMHCELEPGISSLETFLPKLSRLILHKQSPDMFQKWTENSSFKSNCHTLALHMADETVGHDDPDFLVGVNLEMMQSLHLAFPNVRMLNVTVSATQVCGLKYLFMEMKMLRILWITVVGSTVGWTWDFWDALLIGVPINFVRTFRESIDFWEDAQLTSDSAPSIKNLEELTSLTLETHRNCAHDPSATEPLISDLTFLLALLKMPTLKKLTLRNNFQASEKMGERWTSEGRQLVQSDAENQ